MTLGATPPPRQAVTLKSSRGETLYGVLTLPPAEPFRRRLLIFSQAGLQNKAGVGDYFRWLADELALRGFHVLRYDQAGTGDSTGEIGQDLPINDYFVRIQSGASTPDNLDMLAWARGKLPGAEVFLWGQCGGCIPAAMTAASVSPPVAGLILMAPPVLFSSPQEQVRETDARLAVSGYLRKLWQPRSYLRFLKGQSEYRLMKAALNAQFRRVRRRINRSLEALRHEALPDHPQFNHLFWEAFQEVMDRRIPVLFLLAQMDNETPEFIDELKLKVLDKRPIYKKLCTFVFLDQADHSLMMQPAREQSRESMLDWLHRF